MVIFKSENELLSKLDEYDQLLIDCVAEKLPFWEFLEKYNNFYYFYALDGHESDKEEFKLLLKHEDRISLHAQVAEQVLNKVCSDEDANKAIYIDSGRFGSKVAHQRLVELVKGRRNHA